MINSKTNKCLSTKHTFYALQLCTLPLKNLKLVDLDLISSDKSTAIPVPQQIQQMMSPQQKFLDINRHMDHLLVLL